MLNIERTAVSLLLSLFRVLTHSAGFWPASVTAVKGFVVDVQADGGSICFVFSYSNILIFQ